MYAEVDRPPVVTVDLDGTLAEAAETPLAERDAREGAAEAIARMRSAGIWVVVWTANDEGEDAVRSWLNDKGIEFDEINNNKWDDGGTRKIRSDAYLDDKAIPTAGRDWADLSAEAIIEVLGKARQPLSKHDGYEELAELAGVGQGEMEALLDKLQFRTVKIADLDLGQFEAQVVKPGGVVLIAPVKGEKRAKEKVEADYGGNWRKLLDVVRAAVAVDHRREIDGALAVLKEAGAQMARPPKDRFNEPLANGYRDLLANYKLPCGMICEVQFHLKPILIAREKAQLAYDVVRAIKASLEEEGREEMTPAEAEACRRAKKANEHIFARAWEECQAKENPNGQEKGLVQKADPNDVKIGDSVYFLNHKGNVIDFGEYSDVKARHPGAILVAGREVDESKLKGRCWAIRFDDGVRLVGSMGIRLLLTKKGFEIERDDTVMDVAPEYDLDPAYRNGALKGSPLARYKTFCATGEGGGVDPSCSDEGGGGGTATANKPDKKPKPDKPTQPKRAAPGSQMDQKVRDGLRAAGMVGTFPPADVPKEAIKINPKPDKFTALMQWDQKTKSGRLSRQYRYTQEFIDRNAAQKFERVSAIEPVIDAIGKSLTARMSDQSLPQKDREAAAIASVIRETGLRPTDGADSVKHGHFGISSLQARHLKVKGNEVRLDFIGKEGVRNQTTVREPANVAFLKEALRRAKGKDFIFGQASSDDAGDALKAASKDAGGPDDVKVKDLRTLKAFAEARKAVQGFPGPPPPLTGNAKKDARAISKAIMTMSGQVVKVLNNTPTQARDNYIHPEIFKQWQSKLAMAS